MKGKKTPHGFTATKSRLSNGYVSAGSGVGRSFHTLKKRRKHVSIHIFWFVP